MPEPPGRGWGKPPTHLSLELPRADIGPRPPLIEHRPDILEPLRTVDGTEGRALIYRDCFCAYSTFRQGVVFREKTIRTSGELGSRVAARPTWSPVAGARCVPPRYGHVRQPVVDDNRGTR